MPSAESIPVIVNCRDRVSCLRELVDWLEGAGHERIVLVDNNSTYPPLLDYLKESPHEVLKLPGNIGAKALWLARLVPDEWFVYTDPDIVPVAECPSDAVAHLHEVLQRYPNHTKAGLGLYLDDLPADHYILEWERSLVSPERQLEAGVYDSLLDTTFALYRPSYSEFTVYDSLRMGWPYVARHTSWYVDELDAENAHYVAGADKRDTHGSTWAARLTD